MAEGESVQGKLYFCTYIWVIFDLFKYAACICSHANHENKIKLYHYEKMHCISANISSFHLNESRTCSMGFDLKL